MPRPRQATGRPRTPVIPAAWEDAHADVATRAKRARVTLTDPTDTGTPTWVDDQWVYGPATPYATDVPARVQRLARQDRDVVTAEDDEVVVNYLVAVPWGLAEVSEGHLVTVTEATDDLLVSHVLRVHHIALGSERFSRDLFCTLT